MHLTCFRLSCSTKKKEFKFSGYILNKNPACLAVCVYIYLDRCFKPDVLYHS